MSEQPVPDDRRAAAAHVLLSADRQADLDADRVPIADDVAHHLRRVLRVRGGDTVSVTDGSGRWRICAVRLVGDEVELEATTDVVDDGVPNPPLTIATAIPKGDRVDWLVQKVPECGADRIVFLDCSRSVVRWNDERRTKQLARLQRIADEATRQSRRVVRTTVVGVHSAADVLPGAAIAEFGGVPVDSTHATIAIGPEGGWTHDESAASIGQVSLGPHVLRTETAAIAAATLSVVARHATLAFRTP